MINVDLKELAKARGDEDWNGPAELTERERMAVRVITDFRGGSTPTDSLNNASHWIARAIEDGILIGELRERNRWYHKLRYLFGIPVCDEREPHELTHPTP
jgi:hypothetical protein